MMQNRIEVVNFNVKMAAISRLTVGRNGRHAALRMPKYAAPKYKTVHKIQWKSGKRSTEKGIFAVHRQFEHPGA